MEEIQVYCGPHQTPAQVLDRGIPWWLQRRVDIIPQPRLINLAITLHPHAIIQSMQNQSLNTSDSSNLARRADRQTENILIMLLCCLLTEKASLL